MPKPTVPPSPDERADLESALLLLGQARDRITHTRLMMRKWNDGSRSLTVVYAKLANAQETCREVSIALKVRLRREPGEA